MPFGYKRPIHVADLVTFSLSVQQRPYALGVTHSGAKLKTLPHCLAPNPHNHLLGVHVFLDFNSVFDSYGHHFLISYVMIPPYLE